MRDSLNIPHQYLQPFLVTDKHYLGSYPGLSTLFIDGPDAAKFLQGQLTCDIHSLQSYHAQLGAYCDHKGRVLTNFWIWSHDSGYALLLPHIIQPTLTTQLQKYALRSKITFSDSADSKINYHSWIYWTHKNNINIDAFIQAQFIVGRFAIQLPPPLSDYELIWLFSTSTHQEHSPLSHLPQFISMDDCDSHALNMLAGFDFVYPATSALFTPHMLNLEKLGAVSFRKGCYVGQEVIARTQHLGKVKRHLHCMIIEETQSIPLGSELKHASGETVGLVFASQALPEKNSCLILAVLQDSALQQSQLGLVNF